MRKIYALVLLAATLLVGTNAWAVNVPVAGEQGTRGELQTAIDGAATGTTLTLQNDFNLDGPVWLGTADYDGEYGAYKSIILDLNGHNISMTATTGNASYMFVLSHGELLVRNSSATLSLIQLSGTTGADYGTQIFTVFGSYRSTRWNEAGNALETDSTKIINTRNKGWFSHLEIGQNVKIVAGSGILGTGISVDVLFPSEGAYKKIKDQGNTINYRSDIFEGNFGLAQGVKVDIYGDIEIAGKGESGSHKAYCVKVNGYTDKPHSDRTIDPAFTMDYATNYEKSAHAGDTIDVAFIHIHGTANLQSDNKSSRSTAVYSSGYSKMLIEGHCEGSIGVYASSGKVEINNAEIVSTSTSYTTPTGDGGVSGTGSAVVVNSRDGYTGEIEVTISGDSKVTASSGYAIEEIVTTAADTTKVESVTIEGGTIEGGNQGAIIVSDKTASDKDAEVVIYGGKVSGNTQVGAEGDITDILPTNGSETTAHVTEVTDPVSGKTTIVVSEGAPVPASEKDKDIIAGDANTTVNWKHLDATTTDMTQTLLTDMTLKELEINQNYNQTLTLGDVTDPANPVNVTLTVDRMVLGYKAQIIVNPGSKLIIKGAQGIVAPKTSNIILRTSETAQAIFLFHPNVTSNRHPNATVQMISTSYNNGASDFHNHRFGIPMISGLDNISSSTSNGTAFFKFNYETDSWHNIGYLNHSTLGDNVDLTQMSSPFEFFQLLCNVPKGSTTTYTFTGSLVGNDNPSRIVPQNTWLGISNSYMGDMSIQQVINNLAGSMSKTIWTYEQSGTSDWSWHVGNYATLLFDGITAIKPMQAFLVLNKSTESLETATINYEQTVWNPAMGITSAPARNISTASWTTAKMVVSGENCLDDQVILVASSDFTPAYDNGYDAEKYMNPGINFYVSADEAMSVLATDNLADTYLGFSCVNGGIYTINFNNVNGESFDLIDLEANQTVHMTEGASYQFAANDNEQNDYRFRIVPRQEMPTDIETVENGMIKADGVYTITGQYLGDLNIWNTLPAGLYIVNGEKKVK